MLTIRRNAAAAEIAEAVREGVVTPVTGFSVAIPKTLIRDVFIHSSGAERILGVKPDRAADLCGAFVDARDLAVSVRFVVLSHRIWSANEIATAVALTARLHCRSPIREVAEQPVPKDALPSVRRMCSPFHVSAIPPHVKTVMMLVMVNHSLRMLVPPMAMLALLICRLGQVLHRCRGPEHRQADRTAPV